MFYGRHVFLPHDAMHSADYAVARCLSVHLSVRHAPVFYQTTKIIIKLFSLAGSHTILVFPYQTVWQYTDGIPQGEVRINKI